MAIKKINIVAILFFTFNYATLCYAETAIGNLVNDKARQTLINTRLSVKEDKIDAFSTPDAKSHILWQYEKYSPVIIVEQGDNNWIKVRDHESEKAWIKLNQLAAEKTIITTKKANVRSGPGTEHEIVFYTLPDVPFKVLKYQNQWYQVQHSSGKVGWIFETLVW